MSRIGNNPVTIPDDVKVELKDSLINISGSKGQQSWLVHANIKVEIKDKSILFNRVDLHS